MTTARQRFPYLENFVQDWPTKELAKSRLKNRHAYCKKQGYDVTDFGMAASSPPMIKNTDDEDMDRDDRDDDGAGEDGSGHEDKERSNRSDRNDSDAD